MTCDFAEAFFDLSSPVIKVVLGVTEVVVFNVYSGFTGELSFVVLEHVETVVVP